MRPYTTALALAYADPDEVRTHKWYDESGNIWVTFRHVCGRQDVDRVLFIRSGGHNGCSDTGCCGVSVAEATWRHWQSMSVLEREVRRAREEARRMSNEVVRRKAHILRFTAAFTIEPGYERQSSDHDCTMTWVHFEHVCAQRNGEADKVLFNDKLGTTGDSQTRKVGVHGKGGACCLVHLDEAQWEAWLKRSELQREIERVRGEASCGASS